MIETSVLNLYYCRHSQKDHAKFFSQENNIILAKFRFRYLTTVAYLYNITYKYIKYQSIIFNHQTCYLLKTICTSCTFIETQYLYVCYSLELLVCGCVICTMRVIGDCRLVIVWGYTNNSYTYDHFRHTMKNSDRMVYEIIFQTQLLKNDTFAGAVCFYEIRKLVHR